MGRLAAFPEILPYRQGRLRVSGVHEIAFEECGNPLGKPVVVLHGGPGGGSNPYLRRLHDPAHYRIIQFDQRGCGASTPHAELEGNTTWDLVEDMERLREHLGIDRWQVMGGSWGSTLALAYAQTHTPRVTELILRGIFTLRRAELLWFYQEGANWLYPDAWEAFLAPIPEDERHDMMAAYYRRLTGPDPAIRLAAARAWSQWEGATLSLYPDADRVQKFGADAYALAFARIECHYFVNRGFFEHDDELLRNAHKLATIPGTIVHGRHDVVTPLATAHLLHKAWPQAQYIVVPDAGHASTEPGITAALVAATERFR